MKIFVLIYDLGTRLKLKGLNAECRLLSAERFL